MSKAVLRPKNVAARLDVSLTTFYENYVNTGLIKLRRLGPRSVGALEEEVDRLIEELPVIEPRQASAEPENARFEPEPNKRRRAETEAKAAKAEAPQPKHRRQQQRADAEPHNPNNS